MSIENVYLEAVIEVDGQASLSDLIRNIFLVNQGQEGLVVLRSVRLSAIYDLLDWEFILDAKQTSYMVVVSMGCQHDVRFETPWSLRQDSTLGPIS
jgi:hypothetical protein